MQNVNDVHLEVHEPAFPYISIGLPQTTKRFRNAKGQWARARAAMLLFGFRIRSSSIYVRFSVRPHANALFSDAWEALPLSHAANRAAAHAVIT